MPNNDTTTVSNQELPQTPSPFGASQPATQTTPASVQDTRDYEAELKELRAEAAKWRTQLRAEQDKVKELTPVAQRLAELEESQKTEEQKLREKLTRLEAEKVEAQKSAELAIKQAKLTTLAAKAGLSPELAALLDISKLDLEDEAAALETLKKLLPKPSANGGGASNPANGANNGPSEQELRNTYFNRAGQGVAKIFGG